MVYNYFNGIPNTTRAYQSTAFMPKNQALDEFNPDLYSTAADRKRIVDAAAPFVKDFGNYAECSIPPNDAMNFFKSISSTNLPWVGAIFGLTVNATWYWCTDQVIVQRCLAAKNLVNAKLGITLACLLKMLPLWLMVVPGMAARVLFSGKHLISKSLL